MSNIPDSPARQDGDRILIASTSGELPAPHPRSTRSALVGVAVWLISCVYLLSFVERGWIPHDEGLLAHSAERVLKGELPHQDFDDCYTGGLAFLHSVSFRLFGVHLSAMRWTLFGATMLFVPMLYLLALRCCTPIVAGLVTLVCVTWSVPNYFASMPSWYILFFTMAALYGLTRFARSESWIALGISGLCCGIAVLCKINGLFAVAMGLLFLLYHDQVRSQSAEPSERSHVVRWVSTAIAFTWSLLVFLLLRRQLEVGILVNLLVPSVIASSLLSWNEWVNGRGTFSQRAISLTKDVIVFLAGVGTPIMVCLIPYMLNGTVLDVINGVFILPQQRLENAAQPFPPLFTFITTIPLVMLLFGGWASRETDPARDRRVSIAVFAFTAFALLCSGSWAVHSAIWLSVRLVHPLAVVAVALFVIRNSQHVSSDQRELLVLLLLGTTALSLIQFPFAANIYFCYFAPLLILMIVQFRSMVAGSSPKREAGVLVFFLLFAVVSLNRCYVAGGRFSYDTALNLQLSRASLLCRSHLAEMYPKIVEIIHSHSEPGDAIYAAPDCPEIYFLADRVNPTRTMYDFFDSSENRTDRLIEMLDRDDINVVVVSVMPEFSSKMDKRLQTEIWKRFPYREKVGYFIVGHRSRKNAPSSNAPADPLSPVKSDVAANPNVGTSVSDSVASVTRRSQFSD